MRSIIDRNLGKVSDKALKGLAELAREYNIPKTDVTNLDSMLSRYGGYVEGLYLSF